MHTDRAPFKTRTEGFSFSIPELMLVAAWAQFHDLSLRIELDWYVDRVEYEEVITLREPGRASPQWLMWRAADRIVLQPVVGRARRFETISEALGAICPEQV